ncbi:MAG: hypothetical protein AAB917_03265 [Patescibacteria group bacterium]
MKYCSLSKIRDILDRVERNKTHIFSKEPEMIVVLNQNISSIITDNNVHISEFIVAKIKGRIRNNRGHSEINQKIFLSIPNTLNNPSRIYIDHRKTERNKYLFVSLKPSHQIVVEVKRIESGKTEINSIIPLGKRTLKQLGNKFQAVYSGLH